MKHGIGFYLNIILIAMVFLVVGIASGIYWNSSILQIENMKTKRKVSYLKQKYDKKVKYLEGIILDAAKKIDDLENKNSKLKTNTDSNIQLKYEQSEQKHAKNYELLNQKIALLEDEKRKLALQGADDVVKIKNQADKKIKELEKRLEDKNGSIELEKLNKKITFLSNENEELRELKSDINISYYASLERIKILQKDLDKFRIQNENIELFKSKAKEANDKINEANKRIDNLEQKSHKLQSANVELTDEYNLYKVKSSKQLASSEEKLNEISKKLFQSQIDIDKFKQTIQNLTKQNEQNLGFKDKFAKLEKRYKKANNSLKDFQDKIIELKEQVEYLQKENSGLNKKNESLKLAEKSSKKTYEDRLKIAKEGNLIASKEIKNLKQKLEISQRLNNEIKKDFNNLEVKFVQFKKKKSKEINISKVQDMINDLRNRKAEILALKSQVDSFKQKIKENRQKNKEEDLKENLELTKKLDTARKENTILQEKIAMLNLKINSTSKPKNTHLMLDSITCNDMQMGSNEATNECKNRVEKMLKKYSSDNFYEVVPIVDEGGFASLKKVQKSKIGVPDSEIARLTRLSNIGLGKDRIKAGGDIIKKVFNGEARVSYANENMSIPNKRGFIIKVYE